MCPMQMDILHSQTCRTPENELSIVAKCASESYILDRVEKIGLRFKIVWVCKVGVGSDAHASKGAILMRCNLHAVYNELCGEGELQAWRIKSSPGGKYGTRALKWNQVDLLKNVTHCHQRFVFQLQGFVVSYAFHLMLDILLLEQTQIANALN